MGRVIVEAILGLLIFAALLVLTYRIRSANTARVEYDRSRVPCLWFTDSWERGGTTHVGIVRVANSDRRILERRELTSFPSRSEDYAQHLSEAMDAAYAAMREANVNENRR